MTEYPVAVVDSGSHSTKFGLADVCFPDFHEPTMVGLPRGENQTTISHWGVDAYLSTDIITKKYPVNPNEVARWNYFDAYMHYVFDKRDIDPREHCVVNVEPGYLPTSAREGFAEYYLESLEVPYYSTVNSSVMSLHYVGSESGIVLDFGAGGSYMTVVHKGQMLRRPERLPVGGNNLTYGLMDYLYKTPREFRVSKGNQHVANEVKEFMCSATWDEHEDPMEKFRYSSMLGGLDNDGSEYADVGNNGSGDISTSGNGGGSVAGDTTNNNNNGSETTTSTQPPTDDTEVVADPGIGTDLKASIAQENRRKVRARSELLEEIRSGGFRIPKNETLRVARTIRGDKGMYIAEYGFGHRNIPGFEDSIPMVIQKESEPQTLLEYEEEMLYRTIDPELPSPEPYPMEAEEDYSQEEDDYFEEDDEIIIDDEDVVILKKDNEEEIQRRLKEAEKRRRMIETSQMSEGGEGTTSKPSLSKQRAIHTLPKYTTSKASTLESIEESKVNVPEGEQESKSSKKSVSFQQVPTIAVPQTRPIESLPEVKTKKQEISSDKSTSKKSKKHHHKKDKPKDKFEQAVSSTDKPTSSIPVPPPSTASLDFERPPRETSELETFPEELEEIEDIFLENVDKPLFDSTESSPNLSPLSWSPQISPLSSFDDVDDDDDDDIEDVVSKKNNENRNDDNRGVEILLHNDGDNNQNTETDDNDNNHGSNNEEDIDFKHYRTEVVHSDPLYGMYESELKKYRHRRKRRSIDEADLHHQVPSLLKGKRPLEFISADSLVFLVNKIRPRAIEPLFHPDLMAPHQRTLISALLHTVHEASPKLRTILAKNILLTGGSTRTPFFLDRFTNLLTKGYKHTLARGSWIPEGEDSVYGKGRYIDIDYSNISIERFTQRHWNVKNPDFPELVPWLGAASYINSIPNFTTDVAISRKAYLEVGENIFRRLPTMYY